MVPIRALNLCEINKYLGQEIGAIFDVQCFSTCLNVVGDISFLTVAFCASCSFVRDSFCR